jgi:protein-S-isoprenylcysteine O-methyltransferase Ste14
MFDATLGCAVSVAILGALLGELGLRPEWPSHGWLFVLAVSGQGRRLPRDRRVPAAPPAVVASILLLVQPVLTVILAAIVVDERPSGLQVAGVLLVVVGIVVATSGGRREQEAGLPAKA